jgi:hypothetical protein
MAKRGVTHSEEQLPETVMLQDMLDQARPEVYGPRLKKILKLYHKNYDSSPTMPDKIVLRLALWDYFATEIAEQGAEYLVGCVNTVLYHHLGKQLANTDLVDTVSRH